MVYFYRLIYVAAFLTPSAAFASFDSIQQCLDQKYKSLSTHRGIAAAVVDAKHTKITLHGQATVNQIFEIGSLTKTFTANLLAQEVVAGRLKLSDAIPEPYQKTSDHPITYQHLTTHTSGIIPGNFPGFHGSNSQSPYEGLSIPLFKELYAKTPLAINAVPGNQWIYSNIASGLLGTILGEKSRTNYEQLVQNKIFNALGMKDSYFQIPEAELTRFPKGNVNGQSWSHWDLFDTAIDPAGGVRSTITDMAIYARANLIPTSTVLSTAIATSQKPIYYINDLKKWIGMNWIIEPEQGLVWHNGSTIGFRSILILSIKYSVAVVALTDTGIFSTDGVEDLSFQNIAFECLK